MATQKSAAAVLEGLANAEIETASWTKAFIAITVPMVMAIVNLSNAATPAYEAIEGTATDVGTLVNMVMHDAKNPSTEVGHALETPATTPVSSRRGEGSVVDHLNRQRKSTTAPRKGEGTLPPRSTQPSGLRAAGRAAY
jgi:hypothetical protein